VHFKLNFNFNFEINQKNYQNILKILTFNCDILNNEIRNCLLALFEDWDNNERNECIKLLLVEVDQIKDNADMNLEKFFKNKNYLLKNLEKFLI
jgi:hypothetical protein